MKQRCTQKKGWKKTKTGSVNQIKTREDKTYRIKPKTAKINPKAVTN